MLNRITDFWGLSSLNQTVPLAMLCQGHSQGDGCWEGCGAAATPPVMNIFRLQTLIISPCSEHCRGRDWIFPVAWGRWCRKGRAWCVLGCSELQKQQHGLEPCLGNKLLMKSS